jgi:hypothetical protein
MAELPDLAGEVTDCARFRISYFQAAEKEVFM